MKKTIMFILNIIIFLNAIYAYQPPIPETIFKTSENKKILVQVFPLSDYAQEIEKCFLYRNSQIFIIYKKEGNKWQELSMFRAKFKHNIGTKNAEVRNVIVSNNGEFIALKVEAHPWVVDSKVPLIYIYDTKGNLFGSYFEDEIVSPASYKYNEETKRTDKLTNKLKSCKFNDDDTALIIEDTSDKKHIINLKLK